MKAPTIEIDGKTYKAKKKMKVFRKFVQLENSQHDQGSDEGMDEMLGFVAHCFDKEVTPEKIEDQIDVDDFFALFHDIGKWIMESVQKKTSEIPKPKAGKGKK